MSVTDIKVQSLLVFMSKQKPHNTDLFGDKNWDSDAYMAHFMS